MHTLQDETDDLIAGVKSGNLHALEILYDTYTPQVYGWILTRVNKVEKAEEILIKTFLAAGLSSNKFDPSRWPTLIWLIQLANKEIQSFCIAVRINRYTEDS